MSDGSFETISGEERAGVEMLLRDGFSGALKMILTDRDQFDGKSSVVDRMFDEREKAVFEQLKAGNRVGMGEVLALLELSFKKTCLEEAELVAMRVSQDVPRTILDPTRTADVRLAEVGFGTSVQEVVSAGRALAAIITEPPDIQAVANYFDRRVGQLQGGLDLVTSGIAGGMVQNMFPASSEGRPDDETMRVKLENRARRQEAANVRMQEKVDGYTMLVTSLRYPTANK